MWSALMTPLVIVFAVLLISSRRSIRQLKAANNDAYGSGFMAGHVQGWHEGVAAVSAQHVAGAGFPAPAESAPSSAELTTQQTLDAVHHMTERARSTAAEQAADELPLAESPAEQLARRDKRERQNINVTLYVASLLLVAAGALFVGTSLAAVLRFAGVCLITALFYGVGLALHAKAPRLRPAAVAFAGTGLALVPVAGLAMYNFAVQDAGLAWLLTSLVGTLAYVVAAIRLESRVLVYLSFTFVVSTAWSGVSVLGAPLVWYFAAMIGLAVATSALTLVKPGRVTPLFLRPIMVLDPFVVPAVALAATVLPLRLERGEYALIMALCGAYFAVAAVVPAAGHRLLKVYGARLALTIAASAWAWHLTGLSSWALVTAGTLLAVQSGTVASAGSALQRWSPARGGIHHWAMDTLVSFGLQLMLVLIMLVPASYSGDDLSLWAVLAGATTGMFIAAKVKGPAEWAPPAALATVMVAGVQLGPWLVFNLLAAATLFWAVRSVASHSPLRAHLIFAARVAGTLAVPVLTTALMEGSRDALSAAIFSLSLALVAQQLASAAAERAGAVALVPVPTLAGFTAAGALCLVALPVTDATAGNLLPAIALVVQLLVSLGVGVLLFPVAATGALWQPTVAEGLPLAVSATAVLTAYAGVTSGLATVLLLLVVLYLAASGLRSTGIGQRWAYWWMARGAATLLVVMVYRELQQSSGPLVFAGEDISLATVLVFALGAQLAFPLVAAARRRAPDAVVADVALVLVLQPSPLRWPGSCSPRRPPGTRGTGNQPWPWSLWHSALRRPGMCSGSCLRRQPSLRLRWQSCSSAAAGAWPTSSLYWECSLFSARSWWSRRNRGRRRVPTSLRPVSSRRRWRSCSRTTSRPPAQRYR